MNYNDENYYEIIKSIIDNKGFKQLNSITHHGISRYEHLVKVSYYAYKISKKLNWDYISVTHGALLHDFYLDGNERTGKEKFFDTFVHPKKALNTSIDNFNLNEIEKDIIISHMFPLYPKLPKYKESILVNLIDKVIGSKELFKEYFSKCRYQFNYLAVLFMLFISR